MQMAWQHLSETACSPKPGSVPNNTALAWFSRYCDDVGYAVPASPFADPLELPTHEGSPPVGRLFDFCAWLWLNCNDLAGASVDTYISAVRSACAARYNWEFIRSPVLSHYLERAKQAPRERTFRHPVSVQLVRAVFDDKRISLGVRTAVLVAYQALLRGSEYTSRFAKRIQGHFLSCADVRWIKNMRAFAVRVRHSKSDRYNSGEDIFVVAVDGDPYCPAAAIRAYIKQEPAASMPGQPFFCKRMRNGAVSFVTKDDISKALKAHAGAVGLEAERISSHSLRVGAAFELANAGVDWETIGVRGRWSPLSVTGMAQMYARMSTQRLAKVASALSLSKNPQDCAVFPSHK